LSFNVAMLKQMQAEGLDFDAAIRVLEAGECKADPTNAERQSRYRARRKRNAVTVTPVTPPNDIDILTPGSEAEASSPEIAFVLPADIPADPWGAFERMRVKIKKPMTDDARHLAVGRLRKLRDEDGWPPGDVLNHCTLNSYQGIYPPAKARNHDPGIGKSAAAFAALNVSDNETF
jgi:hypothetical protein